ncbi:MAG: carboxymuconolactone decarboxylase family protein [Promethearchaeia archaeon]
MSGENLMDDNMKEYLNSVNKTFKTLGKKNPEAIKGFRKFMDAVKRDGALSAKMKELIGIALSVQNHCKHCVSFHVKKALDKGATEDEIIEACMTAITLGGGPSLMFTSYVLKAIKDFQK